MKNTPLPDSELKALDRLAQYCILILTIAALSSFFTGAMLLNAEPDATIIVWSLIGFAGSAVAALTSCLDRYATGFERENGDPFPSEAKGGKFNRRFSRWLLLRPFLGAIVAPVFIWGLSLMTNQSSEFLMTPQTVGFTAFIGGLLAKSVLELIKGVFKNVFGS